MSRFHTRIGLATAVTAISALFVSAPAEASAVYSAPGNPNQSWTGSLGLDFTVNAAIIINSLGAYSGADANANITVEIFTSAGTPVPGLLTTITTTSTPYTWQSVAPVLLLPGTYQVTAWGYGDIGNYNSGISPGTPVSFNTLGGALTDGLPYYNNPGVTGFATILDNFNGDQFSPDGLHYYGAGNFDASLATGDAPGVTPLPAALPLFASGLGAIGFIGWRRKRKAAP